MTGQQLAEHIGVSYRQVDFWTRKGYLNPVHSNPGSGSPRKYLPSEIAIAERMALLVKAGFQPARAADYARHAPDIIRAISQLITEGTT